MTIQEDIACRRFVGELARYVHVETPLGSLFTKYELAADWRGRVQEVLRERRRNPHLPEVVDVGHPSFLANATRSACAACRARAGGPDANWSVASPTLCSECLAAKRGRTWASTGTHHRREPLFSAWLIADNDRRRLLYVARGDTGAIIEHWRQRAAELGEDPETLIRRRGSRYDLSSGIIAELVEVGAYISEIADALGVHREAISDRVARARRLLGREITRKPVPVKSSTAIDAGYEGLAKSVPPSPNSVYVTRPELRSKALTERDRVYRALQLTWWERSQRKWIEADDDQPGGWQFRDPYVEEGRPVTPTVGTALLMERPVSFTSVTTVTEPGASPLIS